MLLMLSCGIAPHSGGSSEHGNERVIGLVRGRDGEPAAGVSVYLLPDDYNPITDSTRILSRETVTDSNGGYFFDSLDANVLYTIRAYDPKRGTGCVIKGVSSISSTSAAHLNEYAENSVRKVATIAYSAVTVDTLHLDNSGSIYFEIDSLSLDIGMIVFMPGLPYYRVVDSSAFVTFFEIPNGWITLKAYDPESDTTIDLGDDYISIEILSGASLLLPSRSPMPYCIRNDSVVTCVKGVVGEEFMFSAVHPSVTLDGNYNYRFTWGEGTISGWDVTPVRRWSWSKAGLYSVQTQVMRRGIYLAWSDPIKIEITEQE
jgi:hypothetical protein